MNHIEKIFAEQISAGKDKLFFKLMDDDRIADIKWYPTENLSELTAELYNLNYLGLSDGVPKFQFVSLCDDTLYSRERFETTWLENLPFGIERLNSTANNTIIEKINFGATVFDLGNGWKKIDGAETICCWLEANGNILVAGEFLKRSQGLVTVACHSYTESADIIDLFQTIFSDRKQMRGAIRSIRIVNNSQFGKSNFDVCIAAAIHQQFGLTLYEMNLPGHNFFNIRSVEQMPLFTDNARLVNDWQLIISDAGEHLWETRSFFHLRKTREFWGSL